MRFGTILAREIPKHLIKGLNNGSLKLYRSIIKDVSTGRIVGQLQEVSKGVQTIGKFATSTINAGPVGLITQVANLGVSVATKVDTSEIKKTTHRIENKVDTLTTITTDGFASLGKSMQGLTQITSALGIANLVIGVAGIGVSVVGFKKTLNAMHKLQDDMNNRFDTLQNNMNNRFDEIESYLNKLNKNIEDISSSMYTNRINDLYCKTTELYNELVLDLETIIDTNTIDSGYNKTIGKTHAFLIQQIKRWQNNEACTIDISTLLELNNIYMQFLKAYSFKYYCLNNKYIDFLDRWVEPSRLLYTKKSMQVISNEILNSQDGNLQLLSDISSMYKYAIITPYTELYNTQEVMTIKSSNELLELQEALSNISTSDGYILALFDSTNKDIK